MSPYSPQLGTGFSQSPPIRVFSPRSCRPSRTDRRRNFQFYHGSASRLFSSTAGRCPIFSRLQTVHLYTGSTVVQWVNNGRLSVRSLPSRASYFSSLSGPANEEGKTSACGGLRLFLYLKCWNMASQLDGLALMKTTRLPLLILIVVTSISYACSAKSSDCSSKRNIDQNYRLRNTALVIYWQPSFSTLSKLPALITLSILVLDINKIITLDNFVSVNWQLTWCDSCQQN